MKKGKIIEINVSNKLIYGLFILALFIFGIAFIQAVNPSIMGHDASEVNGICEDTGENCDFLNNYYTKEQFDALIASYP